MPKIRTNRAAAKRFKRTGTGKLKRRHSLMRHILNKKASKRKRQLRQATIVHEGDAPRLNRMLPYL